MSADLALFRALQYVERAIGMDCAPAYALHQASAHYQVPAGELAEFLLVKSIECSRARTERDAMAAADDEVEVGARNVADRDRLIAEARAAGGTLEEIADRFGISRQRAHQIVKARAR